MERSRTLVLDQVHHNTSYGSSSRCHLTLTISVSSFVKKKEIRNDSSLPLMEIYLLYFHLEKPMPSVGWVGSLGLRVRKQFGRERDPHVWGIVCADRASVMNMWPKWPRRASHLIGSHTWFKFYGHYSKSLSNFIFDFVTCKWRRITVGAWGLPTDSLPPWVGRWAPPSAGAWVQRREGLAHPQGVWEQGLGTLHRWWQASYSLLIQVTNVTHLPWVGVLGL